MVYLPRDGSTSPVMRVGSVVEGVELGFPGVHIPHMKDLRHKLLIAPDCPTFISVESRTIFGQNESTESETWPKVNCVAISANSTNTVKQNYHNSNKN